MTKNSDGSIDTATQIDFDSGTHVITFEHHAETKDANGKTTSSETDKTETVFDSNFQKVFDTSSHSSDNSPGGSAPSTWEFSQTDSQGQTTTERGVVQVHPDTDSTGTETISTEHPDGSVTLQTTTSGPGLVGTRRTSEYDPSGKRVGDETVKVHMGRQGEFVPDTAPGGAQPEDDEPDLVPDGDSGDPDPDPDPDPDGNGGGDAHGDGDGQPPGGNEASDDAGDGGYGDDTGGHPGLGWDGGDDGPLSLHPEDGGSSGEIDDPAGTLDTLGAGSIADLVAQTYRDALRRAHSGDDGLGDDTGHHPALDLSPTITDVVAPDPEWGDWTNPKAHAALASAIVGSLPHSSHAELGAIARLTPAILSLTRHVDLLQP